jgi:hypothetical protein
VVNDEAPAGTIRRKPYADLCTRVYTRAGKKAHLLQLFQTPNGNGSALCGTAPAWFEEWRGTGTQVETELAASLPLCRYCEKRGAGHDGAERKLADLRQRERAS